MLEIAANGLLEQAMYSCAIFLLSGKSAGGCHRLG